MCILDCNSFDSTVVSLGAIFGLSRETILDTVAGFDCDRFSQDYPNDHRNLKEILPDLLSKPGGSPNVPEQINWFHGTRVLLPDSLRKGIYPLNEQIDQIWQDLFGLARRWVTEDEWNSFRIAVEARDGDDGSVNHRHRLGHQADWGPHAVLVRDALVNPERFEGVDYLKAPETIEDICSSFLSHFAHNLLAVFQEASHPCIVKFRDRQPRPDAIGAAAAYIWCIARNESCVLCNTCYEANGRPIPRTEILDVEIVS